MRNEHKNTMTAGPSPPPKTTAERTDEMFAMEAAMDVLWTDIALNVKTGGSRELADLKERLLLTLDNAQKGLAALRRALEVDA